MMKAIMLGTAGVILTTASAAADGGDRFYASFNYGFDAQDNEAIRGETVSGGPRNLDLEFANGRFMSAAFGAVTADGAFGRLRFDVEVAHRTGDLDRLQLNGVERLVRPESDVSMTTALVNAYYDTQVFADRFRLFVGGGLGVGNIDHEVQYLIERPTEAGGNIAIAIPSTETALAYQAAGGLEVILSSNLSLIGDVRYVGFGDTQVRRFNLTAGAIDSVLDTAKGSVSVSGGLRFKF